MAGSAIYFLICLPFLCSDRFSNKPGAPNLFYYILCGIGAGLIQEGVQYIQYITELSQHTEVNLIGYGIISMDQYLNMMTTVGASGAVYAILLAFGMLYPNNQLFIFPLPFPIKAKFFVIGYAAIELWAGLANSAGDNVAHFAHLGGMLFGLILILYWRKKSKNNGTYYNWFKRDIQKREYIYPADLH